MIFPRVWFDFKCDDGLECLKQYQREWDDDKRMFRDKPRHDWTSHGADAFRMLAVAYQDIPDKQIVEKPIRGITVGNNTVTMDEMWQSVQKVDNRRI